jgi:hypothetical protein
MKFKIRSILTPPTGVGSGTDQHTTLPQTVEHPVRVRHALQRHPTPRIVAERRAVPVVIPLGAGSPQRRRPEPVIHEHLLLVAHSRPVVPRRPNNSLDRLVPVDLVYVCLGRADVGVAEREGVRAVDGEVRGDADGHGLPPGKVQHFRSDRDEGPGEFEEAAKVLYVLEEDVWFAVERVRAVRRYD